MHDENAYLLDGVAAHAGIFSTARDMCYLGMAYNACLEHDGVVLEETAKQMTQEMEEEDGDRRGLIWQLSSSGENAYTRFLSEQAYGHSGFTGCFMWIDPVTGIVVTFLSNDAYNGRDNRRLFECREDIMRLAVEETALWMENCL